MADTVAKTDAPWEKRLRWIVAGQLLWFVWILFQTAFRSRETGHGPLNDVTVWEMFYPVICLILPLYLEIRAIILLFPLLIAPEYRESTLCKTIAPKTYLFSIVSGCLFFVTLYFYGSNAYFESPLSKHLTPSQRGPLPALDVVATLYWVSLLVQCGVSLYLTLLLSVTKNWRTLLLAVTMVAMTWGTVYWLFR